MRMVIFLTRALWVSTLLFFSVATLSSAERPNVLIVTVDDMSADSLGAYGCKLADTSPNIDRFSQTAYRFNHAHSQVGNCMPGRNIMWSGLLSHVNGVEGFVQNKNPDYPVLCDLAKAAGYFAAIRGKVAHSTPYTPYAWDADLDTAANGKKRHIKDARSYGDSARQGIQLAKMAGKPFCLMINISDPHKPFYAQGKQGTVVDDPHVPSRVFTKDEVPVPGFLPSDEVVRQELAHYYSSVRRADDCFAQIMQALEDSGEAEKTFVMFLSDHGMPLPFAKTQLYHHSTHTPLMVRWPGVTKTDADDNLHMVSAVDFLPTLLEVMQHEHPTPDRLHGRSFAPILRGETQEGRGFVVVQYNENSGRNRHPMRGIQTREHLYLYNPWSDGQRKFTTATTGTMTYRQMVKRAADEPDVAARLALFDHRIVEELYAVASDPDCLLNRADDPTQASILDKLRQQLNASLAQVNDPVAPLLADIENEALRRAFMQREDERSAKSRKTRKNRTNPTPQNPTPQNPKTPKRNTNGKRELKLLKLRPPASIKAGQTCTVTVQYKLPEELGKQQIHVTLWSAAVGKAALGDDQSRVRIHREIRDVSGEGESSIEFKVPTAQGEREYQFAVFIGKDYPTSLERLRSKAIPLAE
jgi:N-sulfoglucosamine sulfohydrolase